MRKARRNPKPIPPNEKKLHCKLTEMTQQSIKCGEKPADLMLQLTRRPVP